MYDSLSKFLRFFLDDRHLLSKETFVFFAGEFKNFTLLLFDVALSFICSLEDGGPRPQTRPTVRYIPSTLNHTDVFSPTQCGEPAT